MHTVVTWGCDDDGMRLAVCSSKGGVGKTSTAANLAVVLGSRGRVLAVDADPQDSLGRAFGVVAKGREVLYFRISIMNQFDGNPNVLDTLTFVNN